MKKTFLISFLVLFSLINIHSQVLNPVHWQFSSKIVKGNVHELILTATIDKGWHMYGLNIPENGPVATNFSFFENPHVQYLNEIKPVTEPETKYDATFEMDVELFSNQIAFTRRVKISAEKEVTIRGSVEFMVCDDSRCLPPKDIIFTFTLSPDNTKTVEKQVAVGPDRILPSESTNPDLTRSILKDTNTIDETLSLTDTLSAKTQRSETITTSLKKEKVSLWSIFLKALLGGFLVIITPCVYPVIPLTISYFSRESGSRYRIILNALIFGISIVIIYTSIGLLSGLLRIDLTRALANHWIPNLIFLLIFLALAASFFGMFEIVLPGGLANRIEQQADKGGILGPFFMALATAIISFSCTGPIAGLILGNAMKGDIITPVIGMFGFGLTFALPFTLLAVFPGMTGKLPKSGGWLNSVKVVLAFIILAFSLMFLGNLRLSFITRDVIIALAIAIFVILGIYFLGKIKFPHDNDITHISFFRVLMAVVTFGIAIYLIPGLFGAPLKKLSPFLPDKSTLGLDLTSYIVNEYNAPHDSRSICTDQPKYADKLHMPHQLKGFFDFEEGLACARELNKPVLLDFASETCKNCKKMYAEVWSDEHVLKLLREDFVIIALYTDVRIELPEKEWVLSKFNGRILKTLGKINNNLQIEKFNSNALPLYVIIDPHGKQLSDLYFYNPDIEKYINFLNQGKTNFLQHVYRGDSIDSKNLY